MQSMTRRCIDLVTTTPYSLATLFTTGGEGSLRMRLVIQRVLDARVVVEGKVISEIGKGLLVLVGIGTADTDVEMIWACQKILGVKLFCDKQGKMWRGSVMDMEYEVLCVSQFTLFAKLQKHDRPDFHHAMGAVEASTLYSRLLAQMGSMYDPSKIKDGAFGAMMQVGLTNDGPVTITLDSGDDTKLRALPPQLTTAAPPRPKGKAKGPSEAGGHSDGGERSSDRKENPPPPAQTSQPPELDRLSLTLRTDAGCADSKAKCGGKDA